MKKRKQNSQASPEPPPMPAKRKRNSPASPELIIFSQPLTTPSSTTFELHVVEECSRLHPQDEPPTLDSTVDRNFDLNHNLCPL